MAAPRPLVAFYAPMKAPDHPVPSGDRTVARLYGKALEIAGFDVQIASQLRVYDGVGDERAQLNLCLAAEEEAHRLQQAWKRPGCRRPDLWFTYHVYHKSPDLLGPDIAQELDIPYVIAEPSHAPKRREGFWSYFFCRAEEAIGRADRLFVTTAADAECVAPLRAVQGGMVRLPPFIDVDQWVTPQRTSRATNPARLVTVAMMRQGDKRASYGMLAKALIMLGEVPFHLTVIGDGEARAEVEESFAPLAEKVTFTGTVRSRNALAKILNNHDIFVWPAINEAYGMAPLEASLMGLPLVLGDEGGVQEIIRDGETGFLVPKRQPEAFAECLKQLILNREMARRLGAQGREFVLAERSLEHASKVLRETLFPLLKQSVT